MQESTCETHCPMPGDMECPQCKKTTDSLKSCDLITVVFLFVHIVWNHHTETACPSCMRPILLKHSLFNLFSANLLGL